MKMKIALGLLTLIATTFVYSIEAPAETEPTAPAPVEEAIEETVVQAEPETTVDPAVRLVLDALMKEREQNQKELEALRKQQQELIDQLVELRKEKEVAETPLETPASKETLLLQERDPKELKIHGSPDRSENYVRTDVEAIDLHKVLITGYVVGPRQMFRTKAGYIERRPVLSEDNGQMVGAKGKVPELPGMTLEPITCSVTKEGVVKWIPFWFVVDNNSNLN